ncbi:MAG: hypothetical protein KF773_18515 [Deltaproteobacteria bacterium]|nr:hypothetical protein [Deltaproteobacteria bacterium]MCW5807470.1 hypothetical protein [Deltaproteobacteria bacterium]
MARGIARAPSQNAYRGPLGRTQTTTVHITGPRGDLVSAQVYTTIDAVSDPELVDRLHSEEPGRALNVIRVDGAEPVRVAIPVLYHDPAAELFVLILGEAHRHRELDERIALLERLRRDEAAVPAYAKDFAVVYGASGLRNYLEHRAQEALEAARTIEATRELEKRRGELAQRETDASARVAEQDKRARDLERRLIEVDVAKAEVERGRQELERGRQDIERARQEVERLRSEARNRVIAAAQKAAEAAPPATTTHDATVVGAPPQQMLREAEVQTRPHARPEVSEPEIIIGRASSENFEGLATGVVDVAQVHAEASGAAHGPDFVEEEETTGAGDAAPAPAPIIPAGSDPLTSETVELPMDIVTDAWLDKAATAPTSSFGVINGAVRLALVASEQHARGLGGQLDVRVVLHRTPHYPFVTVVIGPPAALRVPSPSQLVAIPLDIANEHDRQILTTLARKFEIGIDLITRGKRIRRVKLVAPLADNVGYILRAADDHMRGVSADGDASFLRARDLVLNPGFDLLGYQHSDAPEFRDDRLAQLETAQQLRRAIAMARRYARPSREDYLVCTRSFPLPRWRQLRRHVLESAVAWGLWMGPELAQVAVSEGLARSRRDLIGKLDRGFEALKRHPTAFDIDGDAAEDNAKAIAEEARALGVELHKRNGAIASDEVSQVSGSIGGTPAHGVTRPKPIEELLALLDDRQQRVQAAIELCERGEAKAAAPVISAVGKMSRAEAVRVLGMSVKFGEAAKGPLLEGLASSKAFLRHGCALALALLRSEDGTQAVIDLLMTEPTEIWREVARAIGQVGPPALLPLASTYGRMGERATPAMAERVAWAMAHVAVRGGKGAVETMAAGQSVVAPVARQALELHGSAANDQVRVRPGAEGSQGGRDVTVNRAFSRRFFEALEQGLPDVGQAGLIDLETSQPMELLDEADLIEDEGEGEGEPPAEGEVEVDVEGENLDDSDLIQT